MKISCSIICFNEEKNIRRCLESVKWCDEIVVVDNGSTDRTLEICGQYTNKILFRAWAGYVDQKQFALEQCAHDWVLNIDADEEVSSELRDEILATMNESQPSTQVNGYYLLRVVYYLDRWWRKGLWYPEYRLRLCKKSATSWGGMDPHEKAMVQGLTKRLNGELHHYTYTDISDHIAQLNNFSSQSAKSMHQEGKKFSLLKLIFNPFFRFFKSYIIKKGYREGIPGLVVSALNAYYVIMKYAKLWELQRERHR